MLHKIRAHGPFVSSQVRSGGPYELSNGHPVLCSPTGQRGSRSNLIGGAALETDPKVVSAGVDLGVSTAPGMLRAPDIAVGPIEDKAGWSRTAPPLAVEYADVGQDEEELQEKIGELLAAGTKLIWVVRLEGARRAEVYELNKRMRVVTGSGVLTAPGILENPVPLAVLYDRDAAHEATLRNLLQRRGYDGLDAVAAEGREAGRIETLRASILAVLDARGIDARAIKAQLSTEGTVETLERWLRAAATAARASDVVAPAKRARPKRRG